MAESKKSAKISSKIGKKNRLNPSAEKIEKKMKIRPTKQPKSDAAIEMSAKEMQNSEQPKNDDLISQYSIDATKHEERSSSMKIYFPQMFSMLKNMEFLDHISDAENIIFDSSVHAICKDVSTAEEIRMSANGLHFQGGMNYIIRAERLGPAFCAFKRKEVDPTILTIKKLPLGLSYLDLQCRFPGVLDICLKKTMAKLKFADADCCKQAWLGVSNIVWLQGAVPCVDKLPQDGEGVEWKEEVDPDQLMFGHPSKFVKDPCVLFLRLKKRFELIKGMEVLDILKTATDIFLSKSCTVVFPTFKEALKRRQLLAGHTVDGGEIVTWMSARRDEKSDNESHKRPNKKLTKPEIDSDGDDEEESSMAPPTKKMKKDRGKGLVEK